MYCTFEYPYKEINDKLYNIIDSWSKREVRGGGQMTPMNIHEHKIDDINKILKTKVMKDTYRKEVVNMFQVSQPPKEKFGDDFFKLIGDILYHIIVVQTPEAENESDNRENNTIQSSIQ